MILIKWTWFMNLIGYRGTTIFPFIIYRHIEDIDDKLFVRHEKIHIRQQLELLVIPFYLVYLYFYVMGRINGLNHNFAYRANPFEQEAYGNQQKQFYLSHRKPYAWVKYLKK